MPTRLGVETRADAFARHNGRGATGEEEATLFQI